MQPQYPYPGAPAGYPATQPMSVQTAPQVPYGPAPGAPMPPLQNGPAGPPQLPAMSDATVGGGAVPSIAELDGRAVLVLPTAFDPTAKALQPTAERPYSPTVTLTVWVLDGGPLTYGASPQKNRPATHRVDTVPAKFVGILSSHENIVRGTQDKVNSGVVLGRIKRGITTTAGRNAPWNLAPLDDAVPADAQARATANQVFAAVNAGTFVNPTPVELMPAQGAPMAAPPAYAHAAGVPYVQQSQPGPGAVPPGIPPALWATMTPEQQSQYLAATGQASPMPAGY